MKDEPINPAQYILGEVVIITGLAGSGKSTTLKTFEDLGYFCIDNIPYPLINSLADFILKLPDDWKLNHKNNFAILFDCRSEDSSKRIFEFIQKLKDLNLKVKVLFLECLDEILVRRFRETRRPHPLHINRSNANSVLGSLDPSNIAEAVNNERSMLASIKEIADRVIDTSAYSVHDLKRIIESFVNRGETLSIQFYSFGFKFGIPQDADLVVDVRFLPNPYFVPALSANNGLNIDVRNYIFRESPATQFVESYLNLIEFLIPFYRLEGKRYLTIAVGCTGGKHRSVAIVEEFKNKL